MEAAAAAALSRSVTKLTFTNRHFSSSSRAHIGFFRFHRPNVDLSPSLYSLRLFKSTQSISSSSSSCLSSEIQADVPYVKALTESTAESKNVHVKFQLHKECLFGEQFYLVGDDPVIGLWDPASAIPLDWSDEHVWNVELDLPIGKPIRFKFLLKAATEKVFWQPGPDRILETWETNNTIVISEDWENVETQKITEEPSNDAKADPQRDLTTAENVSKKELKASGNLEFVTTENTAQAEEKINVNSNKATLVGENIFEKNGIFTTDMREGHTQENDLVGYVGEPVLVPGLTPLPKISTKEDLYEKFESNNRTFGASSGTDETEDPGIPKDDDEPSDCEEAVQEVQVIMKNDVQWGQKTLHKFLTTLGFSLDMS